MGEVIKMKNSGTPNIGKMVGLGIGALFLLIVFFNSFTTVQAGHSGIITTFGKVNETVLAEGLHVKIPFVQEIIKIDNRVLKSEVLCSSASKDMQIVSSTISLNYKVGNNSSADIYKNVGIDFETKIVNPSIQECVKAVTAKFTAEELITNRQVVSDQMSSELAKKIVAYGLEIQIFNITSFEFSAEFNAAIEAKQTAQQNALKAEQDLVRIKVEAQQQIEQAKAEAESYKLKSAEITEAMIRMEYINKWDGKLPSVISDGTNIMDISSMLGGTKTTTPVG